MAIASNSVTLADYALMSNSPLIANVGWSLIEANNVLQDIHLVTNNSLIVNGSRFEGNLPTVNWSPINAEGVTTKGVPTNYQEQLYAVRNYIDVDEMIVKDKNAIVDQRAVQVDAYMKSLTYDVNNKFFNNDHISGDVNSFVGIKSRIANGSLYGVRPENSIDAGGVNLSLTGVTQATASQFIVLLDQLLWSVDSPEGTNVVIFMNEYTRRLFTNAIRTMGTAGGFSITQDQFGRTIEKYKGAVLRDPGYKQDQATRIIPGGNVVGGLFGENALGTGTSSTAGSIYTSIYAVNTDPMHFGGWQFDTLDVRDLGLLNNGVIYRTAIKWAFGFNNASTRSLARLYDVKVA